METPAQPALPMLPGVFNYHWHLTVSHSLNWGLCQLAPDRPAELPSRAVTVFSDYHGGRTVIICLNLIVSSARHWMLGISEREWNSADLKCFLQLAFSPPHYPTLSPQLLCLHCSFHSFVNMVQLSG